MPGPRLALRLLSHSDALGVRDDLVGDVLEEIANGRSRLWVWQQLIGLFGLVFMRGVRRRVRLTVSAVALACCVVLLAGASIASVNSLVEAWLAFYYLTGTVSPFAHMAAHASERTIWRSVTSHTTRRMT